MEMRGNEMGSLEILSYNLHKIEGMNVFEIALRETINRLLEIHAIDDPLTILIGDYLFEEEVPITGCFFVMGGECGILISLNSIEIYQQPHLFKRIMKEMLKNIHSFISFIDICNKEKSPRLQKIFNRNIKKRNVFHQFDRTRIYFQKPEEESSQFAEEKFYDLNEILITKLDKMNHEIIDNFRLRE